MFSISTHYCVKELLIPDGLFKASIEIQMNTRSKNLDQPIFKLNTLKNHWNHEYFHNYVAWQALNYQNVGPFFRAALET